MAPSGEDGGDWDGVQKGVCRGKRQSLGACVAGRGKGLPPLKGQRGRAAQKPEEAFRGTQLLHPGSSEGESAS